MFHIPNYLGDKNRIIVLCTESTCTTAIDIMSNSPFILQGNAWKFERRIKSLLEVTFVGFSTHCFKDFKIGSKVWETLNGLVTICHPFSYWDLEMIKVCYRARRHHLV